MIIITTAYNIINQQFLKHTFVYAMFVTYTEKYS